MFVNDCPTGCLEQSPTDARLSIQAADVIFQEETISQELYIGYESGRSYGPFQPTFGISGTTDRDMWMGAGAKWTSKNLSVGPFFVEASLMPGVYAQGEGPDLGGALQFRSAVGAGYEFDNGATLSVLFSHRSNADTQNVNPGLETLSLRYAFALN
jgi:lipid A 3-O-deacylase